MPIAPVCCYTMDWITPQLLDLASYAVSNWGGETRGHKKGESETQTPLVRCNASSDHTVSI